MGFGDQQMEYRSGKDRLQGPLEVCILFAFGGGGGLVGLKSLAALMSWRDV